MENRYIRRFALPERMYTASSPVVLAAGVVLEDTRIPRLVAQLKWKSIDEKPLTALTVSVQCPQANGGGSGQALFTYSNLHITRGQTFGVYTAIVLPSGSRSGGTRLPGPGLRRRRRSTTGPARSRRRSGFGAGRRSAPAAPGPPRFH